MAAAAGPEGEYQLGSQRVVVSRGVARLADGSSIAGSVLTLDAAVRNAVSWGVPLAAALDAVTAVPARVLGAAARFGGLAPGQRADAVLLDEQLRPVAVWRDGQLIAG
jgi:N-acetylglucosamine-6-phosphate deacetylase